MDNKLELIEASIKGLVQASMALNNDAKIYYSGDALFATDGRRGLVAEDLKIIKASVDALEKALI